MTENTEATEQVRPATVQQYRHAAKRSLKTAQEAISLRNGNTREVYKLVNGMVEQTIAGRQGLSQDEQVETLGQAVETLNENMALLPEKIAEAKAAVLAQIEAWEVTVTAKAQEAVDTLTEARDFAANRDFEAWQEQKRQKREGGYHGYTEHDEDEGEGDED